MITKDQLKKDLEKLGIKPSDTLLIHSSMKAIGPVEGGADAVLDMLMDYFRDEGLLVFPTLSYGQVNAAQPVFDVRETPSCVGILPQLFRQRPGVIRSLHPTHSLAAFGRDAAEFTAGHEKALTPAPEGSPWWRLLERSGKILFIGTGISCNTFLHGVDEWLKLPGMRRTEPQYLQVVDYDGQVHSVPQFRHAGGRNAFYGSCEARFDAAGAIVRGKFGQADCHVLDCRKIAAELGLALPECKK